MKFRNGLKSRLNNQLKNEKADRNGAAGSRNVTGGAFVAANGFAGWFLF